MAEKPQVAAYINFFLTYVNEEVVDVGYFPASAKRSEAAMMGWLNANNKIERIESRSYRAIMSMYANNK